MLLIFILNESTEVSLLFFLSQTQVSLLSEFKATAMSRSLADDADGQGERGDAEDDPWQTALDVNFFGDHLSDKQYDRHSR